METLRLPRGQVLIVGGGLAGLFTALNLRRPCLILASRPPQEGAASAWAQGGVAAALAPDDSPALHAADTLRIGGGLNDPEIVRLLTEEGPARVDDLAALCTPFDRDAAGGFLLSREAGHSRARVARVSGDLAGKAIMETLIARAAAEPRIARMEAHALSLLQDAQGRVCGLLAAGGKGLVRIEAAETVLAAGGIGGLYAVTTNPPAARGDALAMAARAGAVIADPEFVQFHPTAIDVGRDPAPLATEALRGEGATLIDRRGRRFLVPVHADAELAPRDIVARAIHRQLASGGGAFLDARAAVGVSFPERFPAVFAACMSAGIDPRTRPVPVAPAAHYHMGGIATDAHGASSLAGLSACGECASTGAHGAVRLASNSLLEALVFGRRIAARLNDTLSPAVRPDLAEAPPPRLPAESRAVLRAAMARHAGVERTEAGLSALLSEIDALSGQHGEANPLVAARLVAVAALARRESRGAHFRADYPQADARVRRTMLNLADLAPSIRPAAAEARA